MKLDRALAGVALVAAAFAALPAAHAAPVIQGTIVEGPGTAFVGDFTNVTYGAGGSSPIGAAILICIDLDNSFPSTGTVHTYTVLGGASAPVKYAAAGGRAADLFNYAVDHYYSSLVANESGHFTGYQFSALMWEIQQDFNGTASSLNALSGEMHAEMLQLADGAQTYQTIVGDLRDNYATIADGYRSKNYTVSFLDENLAGYQDMMMLTQLPGASEVPEPGTLALSLLGGLAMWRRARRQRAQA